MFSFNPQCDDSQTSPTEKANIIGQVVGNVKDPDNPRFTLNELKDILTERNTLKSKLIEIEEELTYYKSKYAIARLILFPCALLDFPSSANRQLY